MAEFCRAEVVVLRWQTTFHVFGFSIVDSYVRNQNFKKAFKRFSLR